MTGRLFVRYALRSNFKYLWLDFNTFLKPALSEMVQNAAFTLQTEDITRRYGSLIAVDQFSISVQAGEVIALLGPNGSGKTTLIRIICGLLKPDSGRIRIYGAEYPELRNLQRLRIGYCPQALIIWKDLTCLEQLVFVADMYGISRRQSEKEAQDLIKRLGLDLNISKPAGQLSGGMKRRLNLALALIHDPSILILDEAAAGLDPQSRLLVRELIGSLAQDEGKTILISTHDINEAERLADRVAIMDQGKLLSLDTPLALKRMGGTATIVEIAFPGREKSVIKKALNIVSELYDDVTHTSDTLVIRSEQGAKIIGPVIQAINEQAIETPEIRIRERSLEDVFLTLTGRRLKE